MQVPGRAGDPLLFHWSSASRKFLQEHLNPFTLQAHLSPAFRWVEQEPVDPAQKQPRIQVSSLKKEFYCYN